MNSRECPCGPNMIPCNGKCIIFIIIILNTLKYIYFIIFLKILIIDNDRLARYTFISFNLLNHLFDDF